MKISRITVDLSVESDGEDPTLKFEGEDSQTDSENIARASVRDVGGATSHSCKVTPAIRNVDDQPESIRMPPAVVNLLGGPVEVKTIPQPRILKLDAWHHWRNTGRVFFTLDFLAICLYHVPVRILALDFHRWTPRKKLTRSENRIKVGGQFQWSHQQSRYRRVIAQCSFAWSASHKNALPGPMHRTWFCMCPVLVEESGCHIPGYNYKVILFVSHQSIMHEIWSPANIP